MSITKPGICGILEMVVLISCHDKESGKGSRQAGWIPAGQVFLRWGRRNG